MSEENNIKPSIDDIIGYWKTEYGRVKTSRAGTTYLAIPIPNRRGLFLDLIQTFVDQGYTKKDIENGFVSTKVVLTCWPDYIKSISASNLHRNQKITARQWKEALQEFFSIPISKFKKPEKPQEIKPIQHKIIKEEVFSLHEGNEEPLSDYSEFNSTDPNMDIDFLKEIAAFKAKTGSKK